MTEPLSPEKIDAMVGALAEMVCERALENADEETAKKINEDFAKAKATDALLAKCLMRPEMRAARAELKALQGPRGIPRVKSSEDLLKLNANEEFKARLEACEACQRRCWELLEMLWMEEGGVVDDEGNLVLRNAS